MQKNGSCRSITKNGLAEHVTINSNGINKLAEDWKKLRKPVIELNPEPTEPRANSKSRANSEPRATQPEPTPNPEPTPIQGANPNWLTPNPEPAQNPEPLQIQS